MDLNYDCQILIFEELPFYELILLLETNKHLQIAVESVVHRKLASKSVQFSSPYHYGILRGSEYFVDEYADRIDIRHFPTVSRLLRYFGHLISHLKLSHDVKLSESQVQKIFQLINSHCSESLTRFHISNVKNKFFDEFKRPFVNVKSVILDGEFESLSNAEFNFDDIFPEMRELAVEISFMRDTNWMDRSFAHLEYLTAGIWNGHGFNDDSVKKLIKNNQQLRSLALEFVKPNIIELLANELPHLVHLRIDCYDEYITDDENSIFHFERLKTLTIKKSSHTVPACITFTALEEFVTDGYSRSCYRWMDLVEKQKSLRKLRVTRHLRNFEIERLVNAAMNLFELSIICSKDVDVRNIIKLIESNEQMRKMHLSIEWTDLMETTFDALKNHFATDWSIIQNEKHILFERKQTDFY